MAMRVLSHKTIASWMLQKRNIQFITKSFLQLSTLPSNLWCICLAPRFVCCANNAVFRSETQAPDRFQKNGLWLSSFVEYNFKVNGIPGKKRLVGRWVIAQTWLRDSSRIGYVVIHIWLDSYGLCPWRSLCSSDTCSWERGVDRFGHQIVSTLTWKNTSIFYRSKSNALLHGWRRSTSYRSSTRCGYKVMYAL